MVSGILPYIKTTSLRLDAHLTTNAFFRHVEAEEKPNKKSKKYCAKGSVALIEGVCTIGCVSQEPYPRKFILREQGKLESKHAVKFSKGTWHQIKIRERKGSSRGIIQSVRLVSVVLARLSLRRGHMRKPCTKNDAPRSGMELGENIYKLQNADKATFYTSVEARTLLAPTSKRSEEQESVVDSGASTHMHSQTNLSSDELDTWRRSRNPTVVVTVNGECKQTRKHKKTFTILISS